MALKGKPRDMNKWREVLLDPNVHFPGESSEYRRARNELLEAEDELRRLNEQVAAKCRALPAGGSSRRTTSSSPRPMALGQLLARPAHVDGGRSQNCDQIRPTFATRGLLYH